MPGDGEEAAGDRGQQAVGEDIFDIFKGGEAQRDAGRVNDGVEPVIEVRILPGPQLQEEELGALLHRRHHEEGGQDRVDFGGDPDLRADVEDHRADDLEGDRDEGRGDAQEQEIHDQVPGLLFEGIVFVNVIEQDPRRKQGRDQMDREIDAVRQKQK